MRSLRGVASLVVVAIFLIEVVVELVSFEAMLGRKREVVSM